MIYICTTVFILIPLYTFLELSMSSSHKTHSHKIGKISTALSILCAIHCVMTPILALFLPFIDTHSDGYFEIALIFAVFFLGGFSLLHGYRNHHHNSLPSILFIVGIVLFVIGLSHHDDSLIAYHTILMVAGGIFSAIGQLYNLKLSHL
ncbi:MAG: MerC domain-containing protein [Chitinophagales bacterium]|nr:MerC domain-containing protein [Chitinophagales bacterium]